MLPDFPEVKKEVDKFVGRYLQDRVLQHLGFFGEFPRFPIWEGERWRMVRSDGTIDESEMKKASGTFELPADPTKGLSFDLVLKKLDETAQTVAKEQSKHLFNTINETLKGSANEVTIKKEDIGLKMLNDAFEKMQIDFDDEGKPYLPTFVVGPEMGEKLTAMMNAEVVDEKEEKRKQEIITRKREEFRDRESRRRLVD